MKKQLLAWLLSILLLLPFSAFADGDDDAPAWQAYNGKRIGVLTGPLMEDIAHTYFPDSEYLLFNSYPDCIAALLAGRIDAYLGDEPGLKSVHAQQPRIDYIHERITDQAYSFAFRKNDPDSAALCGELNAFLAQSHEDGTIQELDDIWFGVNEDRKVVDMSDLTGENGTIKVVTTSTDMPFSYIKDGKNVGYDIDLVVRFCRYAGYKLELGDVDFAARIPAIQSGKYDFTTDMNVTPERQEQVLFSDPTSTGGVVLAILTDSTPAQTTEAEPQTAGPKLTDWDGKRMGIVTGSSFEAATLENYPNSEYFYYNSNTDVLTALANNKIDGFLGDEPVIRVMAQQVPEITYLREMLTHDDYAFGFGKDTERSNLLREQFNELLSEIQGDGTMDALCDKWFGSDEAAKVVDLKNGYSAENGILNVVTTATDVPFSYVKDNQYVGLSIELVEMFCRRYGYAPVIEDVDFAARIPGLVSGRYDMCASSMAITEERKESVDFSEPFYQGGIVLAVRKSDVADTGAAFTSLDQLDGARIGVQTGGTFDQFVLERLPHAQISYFNTYTDLAAALLNNKIDGFPGDEPVFALMAAENPKITWIKEYMDTFELGYMLPKTEAGDKLLSEINEYLASIRASGELDEIRRKWTEGPEAEKTVPDYAAFSAPNGVLTLATEGEYAPLDYVRDGKPVGMEIDLTARFCEAYGYGLQVELISFDGIQPSVMTGKVDFAAAGFSITPERAENINFSDSYYSGGTVMAVLKPEEAAAPIETATAVEETEETFWEGVVSSFQKTFIRESR